MRFFSERKTFLHVCVLPERRRTFAVERYISGAIVELRTKIPYSKKTPIYQILTTFLANIHFKFKFQTSMMFVGFLIAIFGLSCQAAPLAERQADGSTFGIYAYGDNINGLPVFYADGKICFSST